ENLRPLPVGAVGELYIGGEGVGRGYLNNDTLTSERFLSNPFQTEEEKMKGINGRIYKTGDLVRYLSDGNIEYVGRNDFQVKIRGFRIELGEIEVKLSSYPGIKNAVIIAKEHVNSANKYLVGYYVSDNEVNNDDLRDYLTKLLPDYMIPSVFVQIERLPLTVNGKLDRRALPEPVFEISRGYVAPRNEMENELCKIFAEILGTDVSTISIDDDFFRLGGDSISSIQFVSRVRQRMNVRLSVKDIFNLKTVKLICENILSETDKNKQSICSEQGVLEGECNLLPVQQWFFANLDKGLLPDYNHFNQSFMIEVPELDRDILLRSISKLVEYHDIFRIRYIKDSQSGYTQIYEKHISDITINYLNVKGLTRDEQISILTCWQSEFNIFSGKLFSVGYLDGYDDRSARIYFALHHLIIDTVSWRIIKDDLQSIYQYLLEHENDDASAVNILGKKGSSYRQWTEHIQNYGEQSTKENNYWEVIVSDIPTTNKLLSAFKIESVHEENLTLDKDVTSRLLKDCNHVYGTHINDILLSALSLALSELTGNDKHHVLMEGHGREEIFTDMDITNTVGWFTIMYPILLSSPENIEETIVSTKESLRKILNNGIGYGALYGYTRHELPVISFNYLGQFDEDSATNSKNWLFSTDNSGLSVSTKNHNNNILSINGGVFDGKLQFTIMGNLPLEILSNFTIRYKTILEESIIFLSSISRSYLTPSDINGILSYEHLNKLQQNREIEGIYLANSLQQGFIYHALNQGNEDDAYRVQLLWDYHGNVDVEKLEEAWKLTQQKYSTLRLRFDWEEELVQIIDKQGTLNWHYVDLSNHNHSQWNNQIKEIMSQDRKEFYDLSNGSLFKVYLIKKSDSEYACLFSSHHSILDGWSNPILLNYLHDCYLKLQTGEPVELSPDRSYPSAQKYLQEHHTHNEQFW
ncbi:MAG: condensation domain-containing protein, partial [Bacteroidales bacterium]|nr:condensation domain-containing protein [Bacteroidales bacterium]